MHGNVFISLNTETYESQIPVELLERYGYTETDEEGNTVEVHPTWEEVAEKNKSLFGTVVKVKSGVRNYYVVECMASWLKHEMSAIMALGNGLPAPQNTLLTQEEASKFINDNAQEEV